VRGVTDVTNLLAARWRVKPESIERRVAEAIEPHRSTPGGSG
jgi:hypothetical protein